MENAAKPAYDALLVVSFGGPERKEDVIPFLENVLRGKPVPRERMLEVAGHYDHFGGKSPINEQNRALIRALEESFAAAGPKLPVYWGNRNWHPLLSDTLRRMADDGVRRALAFVTSAFSSYSGCRQYLENIADAWRAVGDRAPQIDKLRGFFNHPGFIAAVSDRVREAFDRLPPERRATAALIYTAHSIPQAMVERCQYEAQLAEACRLVSDSLGHDRWRLAYQSRSGPPSQPWLEPDICDELRRLAAENVRDVVVVPIGFISDHLEVVYDLDTQAKAVADGLALGFVRAATVGVHPGFIEMVRELARERLEPGSARRTLGLMPPCPDVCLADCCLPTNPESVVASRVPVDYD
ncbi:MAG TPA: ferrochelatase [Pirellulales bacterium]|nr:ferrochelatase [Pirellulales bacterium]